MNARATLLLVPVLLFTAAPPAAATSIDRIVLLADSLSDTNNVSALTGGALPPSPPYAPGRFSNGDIWVDGVAGTLGLGLNGVWASGAPAGAGFIDNYAVAGTFAAERDFAGMTLSNANDLLSFLGGGPVLGLPGLTQQAGLYLSGGIDTSATHVVWAGANDLFFASIIDPTVTADALALDTYVSKATDAVAGLLGTLEAAGVMDTVVFNLPDLGRTPFGNTDPALSAFLSVATTLFNTKLEQALAAGSLSTRLFDVHALLEEASTNPAAFGFLNTTDRCLAPDLLSQCADPSTYIYWDDVHPTSAAHAVLAQRSLATILPEPGVLLLVALGLATLLVDRARRAGPVRPWAPATR